MAAAPPDQTRPLRVIRAEPGPRRLPRLPHPRESWIPVPTAAPVGPHQNFLRAGSGLVKSPALAGLFAMVLVLLAARPLANAETPAPRPTGFAALEEVERLPTMLSPVR